VFSWRCGGFEREMLRDEHPTAPVMVPLDDGSYIAVGGRGKPGTRRRFPQVSSDLNCRYCSAYVKIACGDAYFANVPRFQDGRRRLVITGERAEESAARAKYKAFERHRADNRGGKRVDRFLDHWRPVHQWSEAEVWRTIERHGIQAHPCYHTGATSRASCRFCIFSGPNQWASLRVMDPAGFRQIREYEREFGVTIHRKLTVDQQADRGTPSTCSVSAWAEVAMSRDWALPVRPDTWALPAGAYGDAAGPT